jgi:hypothetical protein
MKRSGFKKLSFAESKARLLAKRKGKKPVSRFGTLTFAGALAKAIAKRQASQNGRPRGRVNLKPGPRMREWARVWKWLKPRLEAAGRTRCEFDHLPHVCSGILTPAHSKKRREMEGLEIYEVAIACSNVHQILDERLTHEQMYVCVMYAIERAGGLITPVTEAARKAA